MKIKRFTESGKSSLIYTYKHDAPPIHKISSQQTDAIIKKIKYIKANTQGSQKQHFQCNIHLWDTTAQQSTDILNNILLKRVNGIILVFDRHNKNSFEKMKRIWDKISDQRKKLYHVEVMLIGNCKQKDSQLQKKDQPFLATREGVLSARRRNNSLVEDQYIRKQRSDFVLQQQSLMTSRFRKNSARRNTLQNSPISQDYQDFTNDIKAFNDSEQLEYQEISVQNNQAVRQVFQQLIGKIMKNIQSGKVSLQDTIIKDTQGKIKLRKFDFKTYQYFQKRHNKCG